MGAFGSTEEGRLVIDSSVESKKERGVREVVSSGTAAPSDGMIEFRLGAAEDGHDVESLWCWMTCETARRFCDRLHNMLQYHEKMGKRNVYVQSGFDSPFS